MHPKRDQKEHVEYHWIFVGLRCSRLKPTRNPSMLFLNFVGENPGVCGGKPARTTSSETQHTPFHPNLHSHFLRPQSFPLGTSGGFVPRPAIVESLSALQSAGKRGQM